MPCKLFDEIFELILSKCIEAGLVTGEHQSLYSTLVKANASMKSLECRSPELSLSRYLEETRKTNVLCESETGKGKEVVIRDEFSSSIQEEGTVNCKELEKLKGSKSKEALLLSNKYYYSKSEPDSRIARKPGKIRDLYYTTHYSSDSKRNVITDVLTSYSDVLDSEVLLDIVARTSFRLEGKGLKLKSVGADKNYCSCKNLEELEARVIE